jgi:tryptophan synthase alpha chain
MKAPGRIEETFARLKSEGRTGFVAFLTVGYPDVESTLGLVPALIAGGADIIELGVPFSDPLAEGPTIQASSFHALQQGVTTKICLETVGKLRELGVKAPLVLMGYYNPILAYGIGEFARDAAAAGADGVIAVDLPAEESGPLHEACLVHGLRVIYLLAPTSTDERIRAVAERASGFVYCVSLTGVTGARDELSPDLASFLERVRKRISLPIAVGFGISQAKHFQAVGRVADAAVIGSAIIDEIAKSGPSEREERLKHYAEVVTGRRGAAA